MASLERKTEKTWRVGSWLIPGESGYVRGLLTGILEEKSTEKTGRVVKDQGPQAGSRFRSSGLSVAVRVPGLKQPVK